MAKKKTNRNKFFVDIPVTRQTREQAKKARKKTGSKSYDEMMQKLFKEILGEELI